MNWAKIGLLFVLFVVGVAGCTGSTPETTVTVAPTQTATEIPTATATETPSTTATVVPTTTPTLHSTGTPTAAATDAATTTPAPPTQTPAPSPTATTAPATATTSPPPTTSVPLDCDVLPEGGFLTIWQNNPQLRTTLGCPSSGHPRIEPAAWEIETSYQPFQHGAMIWIRADGWYEQPFVFALYDDKTYQRFEDTFDPSEDRAPDGESPPDGLYVPTLGFGKLWRENADVRDALGWATAQEITGVGRIQLFGGGPSHRMLWIEQTDRTYVFFGDGTVQTFDVSY